MRPPARRPATVGSILGDVLKRVDPQQQLRAYRIWTFWNDEVGAGIARRAQPAGFRNGILFVTVATHSWMQELQFMRDRIRERLNARLGAELIRDIFFVSGSIGVEPAIADETRPEPAPSGRTLVDVPAIADAELAAAFTRVIEARARRIGQAQQARAKKTR